MTTKTATIRKSRIVATLALLAALVAGCATPQAPVQVVANNYCEIATKQKRTWSVNDTPESIAEAVRHNAGVDRACGVKTS